MCGIAGIFYPHSQTVPSTDILNRMGDAIKHRGPDDKGIYTNMSIGLVHQRLSIIDTTTNGHQPMHSPDGRYTIIFNGEIYNYREFISELKHKGHVFHSGSDTEVLLYMFIEYGMSMLHRLNGMFAFAIWDHTEQQLWLCRDRMGVKPLYYHQNEHSFVFASEPKAIFAAGVPKQLDTEHVNEWLMFRYVAGEPTLLKGIKNLLPGHVACITKGGAINITRWYHLGDRINQHATIQKPKEWFAETFHSSVKYRMVSDVPVGVLLSGGLDSSSITASLHHSGFKGISTFNIGFKNYIHDESEIAGNFSSGLSFPFHSIHLEGHELYNALNSSIHHLDSPLVHMNDPQLLAISTYANKHVKVLLSGEGADETLGGYVRYKTFRHLRFRNQLKLMLKFMPQKCKSVRLKKLERYLSNGGVNQLILSNGNNYFDVDWMKWGLEFTGISNTYRSNKLNEAAQLYPNNPTRQLLYYDQHTYLQSLNDRNDRTTMAASIECREPFQDYRLMEGVGTLELDWLTSGKKGKRILRESMANLLPNTILNFRKIGLSVPWFNHIKQSAELNDVWQNFISNPSSGIELLDNIPIKKLYNEGIKSGDFTYNSLILQCFMFHLWNRSYIQE